MHAVYGVQECLNKIIKSVKTAKNVRCGVYHMSVVSTGKKKSLAHTLQEISLIIKLRYISRILSRQPQVGCDVNARCRGR